MSYGTSNQGVGLRKTRIAPVLMTTLGALLALLLIGATSAKAEPVGYELDQGVINLGGQDGTWATLIDPGIPDPPAGLNVEVAGDGTLTAAASDFTFPPKRIEDLETGQAALPVVDANILITAEGPITGNFDLATGASSVVIPADVFITVYSAGSPASVAKCRIDGFNLNLGTSGHLSDPGDTEATPPRPAAEYDGSPFAQPTSEGAMIATWSGLPASRAEGGSLSGIVCPALDGMLGGPGAVWLAGEAGTGVEPPPGDKPLAPKITGTPSSSTDSTSAAFKFEPNVAELGSIESFRCKLDAGAFEACDSGTKAYSGLIEGGHSFEVKAVNVYGEGPVSSYSWTITKASVTPPPGKAKLGPLKVKPKTKKVKRGQRVTFKVSVKNIGDASAEGVSVCLTAPKKLVKAKKCVKVGQIAAGKTKAAKFKVKVTKKAKKGKKIALRVKASSSNAGARSAKATVKVK